MRRPWPSRSASISMCPRLLASVCNRCGAAAAVAPRVLAGRGNSIRSYSRLVRVGEDQEFLRDRLHSGVLERVAPSTGPSRVGPRLCDGIRLLCLAEIHLSSIPTPRVAPETTRGYCFYVNCWAFLDILAHWQTARHTLGSMDEVERAFAVAEAGARPAERIQVIRVRDGVSETVSD